MRYYGIFSSRYRKQNIEKAKELPGQESADQKEEDLEDGNRVWEKLNTNTSKNLRAVIKSPNRRALINTGLAQHPDKYRDKTQLSD